MPSTEDVHISIRLAFLYIDQYLVSRSNGDLGHIRHDQALLVRIEQVELDSMTNTTRTMYWRQVGHFEEILAYSGISREETREVMLSGREHRACIGD